MKRRLPPDTEPRQRAYTGETIPVGHRVRLAPRHAQRQRSFWQIVVRAIGGIVIILLLVCILAIWQIHSLATGVVVADARPDAPISTPLAPINILLIGTDARANAPEEGVRGDTLLLARIDPGSRSINLLSIPRDSRITLPELGPGKITTAYAYGYNNAAARFGPNITPEQAGMAQAAIAVEQLLALPSHGQRVNYTAQVNFEGFAAIINTLGGIEIDVPRRIVDTEYPTEDFGTTTVVFEPGLQRMDGARALIYARTRHADSDFGRAERQQQVIRAIADALSTRGPLGSTLLLPTLQKQLGDTVRTTLPFSRLDALLGFGWIATGFNPQEIGRFALSPEQAPNFTTEGSDILWNPDDIRAVVAQFLAPPSIASEQALVLVLNGTDQIGLARKVSIELEQAGVRVLPPTDAPPGEWPTTLIYDRGTAPRTARHLAEILRAEIRSGIPGEMTTDADLVVVLGNNAR